MTAQLTVTDLHKSYGTNEVLRGVSLSANAGDVISVIGSSGSGKSTCLRCINFLERPHKASITLEGETLSLQTAKDGMLQAKDNKQLQRFRAKLAMVFQHFNLWAHLNVLDNITEAPIHVLGLSPAEAQERARHYLAKVGLSGAEKIPRPPLRRTTATRRHCPCVGDGACRHVVRRTHLCTRP